MEVISENGYRMVTSESVVRLSTNDQRFGRSSNTSTDKPDSKSHSINIMVKKVADSLVDSSMASKSKRTTQVCIARSAQSQPTETMHDNDNAAVKQLVTESPRVKSYKILGTVEHYQKNFLKALQSDQRRCQLRSPRLESRPGDSDIIEESKVALYSSKFEVGTKDEKALKNWNQHMKLRNKQIKSLLAKSKVEKGDLLMNKGEDHRSVQELKELIDRAIPSFDTGKGYRFNSEFWQQTEKIGDEDSGIETTLTRPRKGQRPDLMQIGKPFSTQIETGSLNVLGNKRTWVQSEYLWKRQKQLHLKSIAPHKADVEHLEIRGKTFEKSIKQSGVEAVKECSIIEMKDAREDLYNKQDKKDDGFYSKLVINGLHLQGYSDAATKHKLPTETVIHILLNSYNKCIGIEKVIFTNSGNTSLTVSLKRCCKTCLFFPTKMRPIQRFYNDCNQFDLQPGETIENTFSFKSPNHGIFTESWIVTVQPKCFKFGSVRLMLRGVATFDDCFSVDRALLERGLKSAECKQIVATVISMILDGITEPVRPSSPLGIQETERDKFNMVNRLSLEYDADTVASINRLCRNSQLKWNYSISNIFLIGQSIIDENERELFFEEANILIKRFHFRENTHEFPSDITSSISQGLSIALDKFHETALSIFKLNNLPERTFAAEPVQEENHKKNKKGIEVAKGSDRPNESRKEKRDASPLKVKQQQKLIDTSKDQTHAGIAKRSTITMGRVKSPLSGQLHTLMYNLLDEFIVKYSSFE